jgi:hypothetical protein
MSKDQHSPLTVKCGASKRLPLKLTANSKSAGAVTRNGSKMGRCPLSTQPTASPGWKQLGLTSTLYPKMPQKRVSRKLFEYWVHWSGFIEKVVIYANKLRIRYLINRSNGQLVRAVVTRTGDIDNDEGKVIELPVQ